MKLCATSLIFSEPTTYVTGSGKRAHLAQVINFQFIAPVTYVYMLSDCTTLAPSTHDAFLLCFAAHLELKLKFKMQKAT